MQSIQELDHGRANNFDLLRLGAATIVIFSHAYLLTGTFTQEPLKQLFGFLNMGALGVSIFFTISGYLILKSLYRQKTIGSFVWARALRIFPGLIATALFCVLVIGPLCTSLPLTAYFKNRQTLDFTWRLIALHNFGNKLPGVFIPNPYTGEVNSPVWTLPAEVLLYLGVVCVGLILLLIRKKFREILKAVPVLIILYLFFFRKVYTDGYMELIIDYWGMCFAAGMLFYWFRQYAVISLRLLFAVCLATIAVYYFDRAIMRYALNVLVIYGVFVLAYHPKLQISKTKNWGDFSYGLYIYAFPIQQLLVAKHITTNAFSNFLLAYLLTFPLAMLSWYYLEKPMLALKNKSFKLPFKG